MLIAHISDTHIVEPGRLTSGVAPMAENLRRCVESLNALRPQPDVVLLSGDVTNDARPEQARHAKDILSGLNAPLFIVPGNHDDRYVLRDVFGPEICPEGPEGCADFVIREFPLRIIALDSLDDGKPGGRFDGARLAWLRARLEEAPERPTVIVLHHPPLRLGIPETDDDGFIGSDDLGACLAGFANIERVLCGHIHLHTNTLWNGTVVTTAPSMGMQLTLDLTKTRESQFLLSEPAYLLHHWGPEQTLVTHLVDLRPLDGPYDFTAS